MKDDNSIATASLSPPPTTLAVIVNILAYSGVIILAVAVSRKELRRLSGVPTLIAFASILRIIWFLSEYIGWGETADCKDAKGLVSFCGRLASFLYISAFSSVLFFWLDVLVTPPDGKVPEGVENLHCWEPRTADILMRFWTFVVLAGLFAYKFLTCDDAAREAVSNAEILAIAFTYALLTIGYGAVGSGLRVKLGHRESVSASRLRFRITVISGICTLFFFEKTFLFLMHPLFGVKLKGALRAWTYPWFFYTIPEIGPALVLLSMLMNRKKVSISAEDAMLLPPEDHERRDENNLRIFQV